MSCQARYVLPIRLDAGPAPSSASSIQHPLHLPFISPSDCFTSHHNGAGLVSRWNRHHDERHILPACFEQNRHYDQRPVPLPLKRQVSGIYAIGSGDGALQATERGHIDEISVELAGVGDAEAHLQVPHGVSSGVDTPPNALSSASQPGIQTQTRQHTTLSTALVLQLRIGLARAFTVLETPPAPLGVPRLSKAQNNPRRTDFEIIGGE
ncbi:hypothetical protein BOTBODRAFT_174761 [Botryobasidium botryosum FD-172 SS1]|uniref:Uncharacterized protein n=1 Tax=Botryobasidium botryosum (strain FD-172 SS1) TaxID=930990 RepID=A0A067MFK2_BOTB1|nr:hypothetical protein BOTBODRAFT_174761 [Botryobasidium botryosum FD-172 SS1]